MRAIATDLMPSSKKNNKKKVAPQKVSFKPPPESLNEHFGTTSEVRMEAVVSGTMLTMKQAPKGKEAVTSVKDGVSNYKKNLYLRNTLGWYYYLPAFMRPKPKLQAAVAAADTEEDANVPAGATKRRNMMLLCEMATRGNWSQMEALIDLSNLNVNEADTDGEIPLCAAAANGHDKVIVKLFRDYRVNLLNTRPASGETALIAAAQASEVGAAKALLECAKLLPVRLAYDHLKAVDKNDEFDARAHAVKVGCPGIVEALDAAEHQILSRPAQCRHSCGIPITFGEQVKHENELCPMYTCLCANGCGERVRRSYMDIHQGFECTKRLRVPSPR